MEFAFYGFYWHSTIKENVSPGSARLKQRQRLRRLALLGMVSVSLWIVASGYAHQGTQDLAGSKWNGTLQWTEKRRTRNRMVDVPYSQKVTLKFLENGSCNIGNTQTCTWQRTDNTLSIKLERSKKECGATATLTIKGNSLSGTWDHYGGFSCTRIPPARVVTLT